MFSTERTANAATVEMQEVSVPFRLIQGCFDRFCHLIQFQCVYSGGKADSAGRIDVW